MRTFLIPLFTAAVLAVTGCGDKPAQATTDMAQLRQAIQQKTEALYWIHLRLDTAVTEISNAQLAMQEGNCSGSEFMPATAYRELNKANEAVLDLGRELQELVNSDVERANRR